ncbi:MULTISPECIES: hypothetical protein [unclassified Coleofasciculus]|uniref:hypothetical protein n=1 Tax=unclassified Coleofasciculus TaxID=2692782 RepID=UPI001880937B|nr:MULTISPECIES: hypothetical protein [unclassified Coleofasciculus]MBE9130056.1 hypothetical protein [Coleofasciculus sp. LEGE 07081]MBE9152440.1 hypothetical protein [Coleofasciculus sp. LEGE 07092]
MAPTYTINSSHLSNLKEANLLGDNAHIYLTLRSLNNPPKVSSTVDADSLQSKGVPNKSLLPALERLGRLGLITSYTLPAIKFTWRVKPTSAPLMDELKELHQGGVFDGKGYLRYVLWYESNKGAISPLTVNPNKMLTDWGIANDDLITWMSALEYVPAVYKSETYIPAKGCITNDLTGTVTVNWLGSPGTVISQQELAELKKTILSPAAYAYFAIQSVRSGGIINADELEKDWKIPNTELFTHLVTFDRRDVMYLHLGDTVIEWLEHPSGNEQDSLLSELGKFFYKLGSLNPNREPFTPVNFANLETSWEIHRYDLINLMVRLVNLKLINFDLSNVNVS